MSLTVTTPCDRTEHLGVEMADVIGTHDQGVSLLEDENARLREENQRLLAEREIAGRLAKWAGGFATLLFLGPGLVNSVRAWLKAKSLRDPLPVDETAKLAAAVLRRVVRVGTIGLIIAALPTVLLLWQNFLIREQIQQQTSDTSLVRRAQLLTTIYEQGEMGVYTASPRSRREAVIALCAIERSRGVRPDLRDAYLIDLDLSGADLSQADFFGASLNADLSGANLSQADFDDASLGGAELRGADLRKARNLTQDQIDMAFGDAETQLPEGLKRPEDWQ